MQSFLNDKIIFRPILVGKLVNKGIIKEPKATRLLEAPYGSTPKGVAQHGILPMHRSENKKHVLKENIMYVMLNITLLWSLNIKIIDIRHSKTLKHQNAISFDVSEPLLTHTFLLIDFSHPKTCYFKKHIFYLSAFCMLNLHTYKEDRVQTTKAGVMFSSKPGFLSPRMIYIIDC